MFKQKSLKMKNLIRTSLIVLVAFVAFSCSNDDDNNVDMNTEASIMDAMERYAGFFV